MTRELKLQQCPTPIMTTITYLGHPIPIPTCSHKYSSKNHTHVEHKYQLTRLFSQKFYSTVACKYSEFLINEIQYYVVWQLVPKPHLLRDGVQILVQFNCLISMDHSLVQCTIGPLMEVD